MTVHIINVFLENVSKPTLKTDLPRPQQRIERTEQLIYCNTLLLQDSLPLSSFEQDPTLDKAEVAWLVEIKNDPIEQDRLQWLANRMVEKFIQEGIKDSTKIAEIVALGPIFQQEPYRKLLSSLIKELDDSLLLNVDLLQGLVQLVQSSSPGYLVSDDLIKILGLLRIRLQGTHQQSTEHPYYLTLAISRVLDFMADHKIQGLDRILEQEPLSGVLSGLKGSTNPYLMYQACYAFQALQYVPNNETVLQAVLRHSRGVVEGVVKVTALGKLDLGPVLEGLGNLQEALGGIADVAGTVYEGASSLVESGQGVMASLKERYGTGQKRPWYAAIRAAYAFAQAGQLKDLNRLVCEAPCHRDPLFQWGVCQLLGEIAVDPLWSVASRQRAIELLGRLYKEDTDWGCDGSVKAWMLAIVDKLVSIDDRDVAASALILKQELASENTPMMQHPYPLRSRLLTPATSSILVTVQDVPYLEYELYKLRLQRLQEYDERAIYVLPQAKPSLLAKDDEMFPLLEKVLEFLGSDRQVMLILGDSGSGKSSFNRYLEHALWTEYKRGGPIPLFINLAAIDDPQHDLVSKQLQFHNFDEDQILELKLHRHLVLICDGYDESQQLVNLHRTNSFNQPDQWNTKMVISCRSQYLGPSYQDRFKPQSTDRYKPAPHGVFQEAVIAPFSKEQIEDYVEQYVPMEPRSWSTQEYIDKLTTIPNLMDLVRNPFLLLLALEALPDVIKGKQDLSTIKIVRVQLYDTFVNHWINVNMRRLQSNTLSKDDHNMLEMLEEAGFVAMGADYSMRLALSMFEKQNRKAVVQYVHLKDKSTWKAEFFGPDPEVRLLREASPLTRSGSFYQFLHRSMLEYFFSCTIVGPWKIEDDVDEFSYLQLLDPECPLFTRSLIAEQSVIQFLSERVQENSVFRLNLEDIITNSCRIATLATAAANAITILVRAGIAFHRHDFQGVRIPGADLSGGQFDSALFQEADLTGVDLGKAWLRKADFSNAQMEGVRFGELPYLQEEHRAWNCCYSLDGALLAVGLSSGGIALHDTETWREICVLEGHDDVAACLTFSPDGRRLASGSEDKAVRVWDCSSGDLLLTMEAHTDDVTAVAFSPCGEKIASASMDKTVQLWNSVTGEALFALLGHTNLVTCVKFTPDGRQLVTGGWDESIRIWDADTGSSEDVWELSHGPVRCLDISPGGRRIVSGHRDGGLRLWNTASGSAGPILRGHTSDVSNVMFSTNGQRIASASYDSTARLWDTSAGTLTSVFSNMTAIFHASLSSDGQHIASVDSSSEVRLWDVSSSGSRIEQHGHSLYVVAVAYLPTGQTILSGSADRTIRQWDARTGAAGSSEVVSAKVAHTIAFSPDFHQTAAGHIDGTMQLCDLRIGEIGPILEGHTDSVLGLTFSPCGQWVASASSDNTVRLWNLKNTEQGHVLANMDLKDFGRSSVTFSPTGLQVTAAGMDGTVNVYDVQTRRLLRTTALEGRVRAVAYSPNGQELAIGVEGFLFFWDLQSKEPDFGLEVSSSGVCSIVYSPCERWIACGNLDSTIQLCRRQSSDIDAWCHVATVEGSLDTVSDIAWNPVVPLEFATCGDDRAVRVWRILEGNDGDDVVSVDLVWGSNVGVLAAVGMRLDGVVGLGPINRRLLMQRGAVDGSLTFEGDESDTDPDDN
ncbi:hypothetical protein KI688_005274 [Linnemannia hyalina]|uniref:WD40 repeat-like protein n=1 Tax=Linnemannia hyalina TaxID=64524 RepID=A0A9P7XKP4_9FUNG|nr:hypothetical protein KI688_005274 [Linnemannia hyalina]